MSLSAIRNASHAKCGAPRGDGSAVLLEVHNPACASSGWATFSGSATNDAQAVPMFCP